ncbi:MAG TPA: hypothetical protein DCQ93_03990 [Bacteroidetes bacterium]|nr:hypothetical protein [Bacteroidota bacterium]
MEIKLTNQECEEYFYNALCNAVGTGVMSGYGLSFDFEELDDYDKVKAELIKTNKSPCFEDVLMHGLRMGYPLQCTDEEGDGDYTKSITIQDIYERMPNCASTSSLRNARRK